MLRCRNKRPIEEHVRFVLTMKFSLNVMSPTSDCICTVAIGASHCPLATIIWNSGGRLSIINVCEASNHIFRESASGMEHEKDPVPMSPLIYNSWISIRYYSILRLFFNGRFVQSGRNLVSPSVVTWSFGII